MCDYFGWESEDDEKREAFGAFKDALVLEFNHLYGSDIDNIKSWRGLCFALKEPPPQSPSAAKKVGSLDSGCQLTC